MALQSGSPPDVFVALRAPRDSLEAKCPRAVAANALVALLGGETGLAELLVEERYTLVARECGQQVAIGISRIDVFEVNP